MATSREWVNIEITTLDLLEIRSSYWIWLRVPNRKLISLFLNQNIRCGYSKEPSRGDSSFEQPKHMLKLMGKKNIHKNGHYPGKS